MKDGAGGPATAYEKVKNNAYADIDSTMYDFVPFIIESCGGVGQAALCLCKELEDQREAKEYWKNIEEGGKELRKFPNPLLTAINIEVQKFNSRIILEWQPLRSNLTRDEIHQVRNGSYEEENEGYRDNQAKFEQHAETQAEGQQQWGHHILQTRAIRA